MKVFKFRFSKLTTGFIIAGLALAVAAFGVTLYNVITFDYEHTADPTYKIVGFAAMFFVSTLLAVLLVSLLVSSYYAVGNKTLKTSFGLVKSKFSTDDMESIILDRETDKLAVHMKNSQFIMIAVKPEWYEDFVTELLKCNPSIEYTVNSVTNKPDDRPKK